VVGVLGPDFQKLLNSPERHDDLFIALGGALGFCNGAYAAFGTSRLAVVLAFPAVLFGLLPFLSLAPSDPSGSFAPTGLFIHIDRTSPLVKVSTGGAPRMSAESAKKPAALFERIQ
jgi:hypothetical protein